MIIETITLATSTNAVLQIVGVLAVKIAVVLGATLGLGIGLWFLMKTMKIMKEEVDESEYLVRKERARWRNDT